MRRGCFRRAFFRYLDILYMKHGGDFLVAHSALPCSYVHAKGLDAVRITGGALRFGLSEGCNELNWCSENTVSPNYLLHS